jgi:DNA-3-methyladenine glycosylase
MMERRGGRDTLGPGKLTQALGITQAENRLRLTEANSRLWIEAGHFVPDKSVTITPRVGLNKTPEPWLSKPWRFRKKD